jgi:hypothetical protein
VVVPLKSVSRPGHSLEGTRLTLVKVPNQPAAHEFSIRTPVTPPRWKDFDQVSQGCVCGGGGLPVCVGLPLFLTDQRRWKDFDQVS